MTRDEIMKIIEEQNVHFFRLQFVDIFGYMKNVAIPRSQIDKALDGQIMFDGSSIDGFVRINESDMSLKPDMTLLRSCPGGPGTGSPRPGLSVMCTNPMAHRLRAVLGTT